MHHIEGPNGTHFNFNSDLSGNIEITIPDAPSPSSITFGIPGDDLKRFMANWIMGERISKLESMSDDELLLG